MSTSSKHLNIYEVEETLARELQKRKMEQEAKQREIQKIFKESEDLNRLKQKINIGYISKERAAQIREKQLRTIESMVNYYLKKNNKIIEFFYNKLKKEEAEIESEIFAKREKELEEERQKEMERKRMLINGKYVIF